MESGQPTQVSPCRGIESQLVRTLTLTRSTPYSTSSLFAGHFVTGSSITTQGPIILTHGPKLRPLWLSRELLPARGDTQGQERGRPIGMGTRATRRIRAVVPSVLDPWRVLLLIRVPASLRSRRFGGNACALDRMRRIIGNRTTVPVREAARLVSMKGSHS